ncbi:MAG TPA: MFS transporter [bacterium]|nr:MFS transporter [bacterium]
MERGINYWVAKRLGRHFYYGWAVAGVALVANLSAFSFNALFGLFITPLQATFGWDRADIARAIPIGTTMGATIAPGLGFLIDRIGTRKLMVGFGLGAGVCLVSLSTVRQVWQFDLVMSLLYPLAWIGVGQMIGSINVSRWFVRRRGRAMGIVMMGASLGAVLLIPVCTFVIQHSGWRLAYVVLGGLAVLFISVPAFLVLVDRPEQLGLDDHPELKSPGGGRGAGGAAGVPEAMWSLREAMGTRSFWMTLLGLMMGTLAVQGYFVHAVPHMEARGFSRVMAGAVWSLFFTTGVVAKFLWGFIIERIGVRVALVTLFLGEAVGLYLLLTASTPAMLFTYAVVNGLLHGPYLQLQAMVWADYFGRNALGRIYGVAQPAIVVAGSMGPWLGGHLFDLSGNYTHFFRLGIVLCLCAALLFLVTPPPRQRTPAATPASAA